MEISARNPGKHKVLVASAGTSVENLAFGDYPLQFEARQKADFFMVWYI